MLRQQKYLADTEAWCKRSSTTTSVATLFDCNEGQQRLFMVMASVSFSWDEHVSMKLGKSATCHGKTMENHGELG